jgi:dihydropteroate synthase
MSAPESTRPGAAPVAEAEELARIEPVMAEFARALDVLVSVDTRGLPWETDHE